MATLSGGVVDFGDSYVVGGLVDEFVHCCILFDELFDYSGASSGPSKEALNSEETISKEASTKLDRDQTERVPRAASDQTDR